MATGQLRRHGVQAVADARTAHSSGDCSASSGHTCTSASAAALTAWSRIESGMADMTAARTTRCTGTIRVALPGQQPGGLQAEQRGAIMAGFSGHRGGSPMKPAAARVAKTVSGMPWQPRRTASARRNWPRPPGESSPRALHRQRPGHRLGRGLYPDHVGDLLPPFGEPVAMLPAGDPRTGYRRAGLGQGQRVTAKVIRQSAAPSRWLGSVLSRAMRYARASWQLNRNVYKLHVRTWPHHTERFGTHRLRRESCPASAASFPPSAGP